VNELPCTVDKFLGHASTTVDVMLTSAGRFQLQTDTFFLFEPN